MTSKQSTGPVPGPGASGRHRAGLTTWMAASMVIVLTLAIVLGLVVFERTDRSVVSAASPSSVASGSGFVPVARGPMLRTVRVGGTLAAVHFSGVSAPALRGTRFQLTIVRVAPAGTHVQPGDVIAEFDRQQQKQNFDDHEALYNDQNDAIIKRQAELKIEREKQLSDLQKAKADLESAKLENRRNEILSKIDAEKNEQALAEAEATLKMQQETLDLRQASAVAEIRLLEIKRDREKLSMDQARINYDRLVVKAQVPGLVVYQPFWKSNKMGTAQEGDQVWPGLVFMQIVDTTAMAMRAHVNQLDAKHVQVGGAAEIRLDAYPDLRLKGRVESISPLGQNGSFGDKTRLFNVWFTIQGGDPRLIPDISASADVELDRIPDAILVPRGAVARLGGGDYVWVQNDKGVERRQVTLGACSDTNWAVTSGLREGELVAAIVPDDGGKKTAPEAPKTTPEAPKTAPEAPKTAPEAPKK
jgi:HlyD family secretion protein